MSRRLSELALGVRFALTGGSDARWRAVLTAAGVALGVALLLLAAATPNMIQTHNDRVQARLANIASGKARLYELDDGTVFHGQSVTVMTLQAVAAHPPTPPGLDRIPTAHEMYVSPALERLLRSAAGHELARRLDAHVVGVITQSGLSGPAELFAYRGGSGLRQQDAMAIQSFGAPPDGVAEGTLITLLVIVMVVALLLPIGVFVATASHFGSEQRNERLAAVRLLGADRASTARIAAGETLVGAIAGVVIGLLGFILVVRPVIPHVEIAGISVFASDVKPTPLLALLIIILVPAAAVLFTLLTLRQVAIEPLGVSRHAQHARRRIGWRVLTPLIGLMLLLPLAGNGQRLDRATGQVEASTGIVLMLIGVCALLPWLVEAAVVRAHAGPVPWLLAVRRLRADHGTSGRVVSAVALTVAGAIALQTLFSSAQARVDSVATGAAPAASTQSNWQTVELFLDQQNATAVAERRLQRIPAVKHASTVATVDAGTVPLAVAPCSTLIQLLAVHRCSPDSIFIVAPDEGLRPEETINAGGRTFRLPSDTRTVRERSVGAGNGTSSPQYAQSSLIVSLMLTPGAAARVGLHPHNLVAAVSLKRDLPDPQDALRDAVATIDPQAYVYNPYSVPGSNGTLEHLKRILIAGAAAVLLVIGASLLVSVAEQLRERRRVLAVLSAFGARRTTLSWSVVWQTLVPVAIGLLLAICLGMALGAVLMHVASLPITFDWGAIAILVGASAAVVTAVTALTLPLLWREMRPDALRAE